MAMGWRLMQCLDRVQIKDGEMMAINNHPDENNTIQRCCIIGDNADQIRPGKKALPSKGNAWIIPVLGMA